MPAPSDRINPTRHIMYTIFFNDQGLLRSGWRALIFLLAFIFINIFFGVLAKTALTQFGIDAPIGSVTFLLVNDAISLILSLLLGWLLGKRIEHLPFKTLGASFSRGWPKHFALGSLLGAATLGIAVLMAVIIGGLRFELNSAGGNAILISLLASLGIFALASAFEEAFFRGYILQTFARSGLAWLAILLTSLAFGVAHLRNPNANTIGALNTVLAGIWLSVAYLKTRDLWFVWGVHLMWNFVQGAIFGVEVSGMTEITTAPLFKEIDTGPAWLTGETYGIEGGVLCTLALLISTLFIYFMPGVKPDEELLALNTPNANLRRLDLE